MRTKKIGYIVLILIGIVITLSVSSHLYISYKKTVAEKKLAQAYQQTHFNPEEIKQDLDFFQDLLDRVHPDQISTFPLGDIESQMKELQSSTLRSLTCLQFYRQFAPVVNLLNDEHVMVFPPESVLAGHYEAGGSFFPFDVQFIDNQLYVAQNLSDETEIQAGMEIVSINDVPAEELRTTLMIYYSGTRDAQKLFYLQDHFREALFLVYGFGDSFELIMRDPATNTTSGYVVSGKAFTQPELEKFRYEVIAPNTILFTYNAFEDENDTFAQFLKEMFTVAQEQSIQHLIIDIRSNQGGPAAYGDDIFDYLTAEPFIQFTQSEVTISKEVKANFIDNAPSFIRWFPIQYLHPLLKPLWVGKEGEIASFTFDPFAPGENTLRLSGDVYLLIGPGTMSSASLFSATMQKYTLGTLIGEDAGGYATQYGNVVDAYLPNTGLLVWMPTSVNFGNSTGPIVPDHTVTQTVADLIEHKDTILEFVRNLIQRN